MAKEHFQDIVPASERRRPVPIKTRASASDDSFDLEDQRPERSIRNISAPRRRTPDAREATPGILAVSERGGKRPRWILWFLAGISVLFLGAILLVALRHTTVTVTPRSHTAVFDSESRITAFPAVSAATGSLAYTVRTVELTDSEVVPSSGTVRAEYRASATLTVFNNFSTDSVRLLKNTRFESSTGLIFRAPAEVIVPGKRGTTPGQIRITVVADQAGEKYNVAASKFTLPGLKSSGDMFEKVYAQSETAATGGFTGERPGVSQSAMDAAIATLRTRLEKKARDSVGSEAGDSAIAFPDLISITYEHLPNTSEAGGGARIHERARVEIPVFLSADFARTVASTVAADASDSSIRIVGGEGYAATGLATSTRLGTDPLQFSLAGSALLVWIVDEEALRQALAGKEKAAFQSIATAFPGIEAARARIEPFWSGSFPKEPADIRIRIEDPTTND
ncbi:MAG TPA: hypothetical protein VJH91_00470 [Candidatus Paceibacterota bacterium]